MIIDFGGAFENFSKKEYEMVKFFNDYNTGMKLF